MFPNYLYSLILSSREQQEEKRGLLFHLKGKGHIIHVLVTDR